MISKKENNGEKIFHSPRVFPARLGFYRCVLLRHTHLGCHVTWHPDIQRYISPCHNGHLDILEKTSAARRRARWMSSSQKWWKPLMPLRRMIVSAAFITDLSRRPKGCEPSGRY
jgi:hypothetical protein